ncbi:MAG: LysR family transcriptional regulator [Pseudomonadales bacterium]|nr:LysR family transcriptional regulator [Pseudomonadales bacterium]
MDLKSLQYFVAAYEEGNITAAAKRCHISQPSISSAIASLETQLAATLFARHKKGVTPTLDGDRLYKAARRLLSDATSIKAMFKKAEPVKKLTIGVMTALDVNQVMRLLKPLFDDKQRYEIRLARVDEPCDARLICEAEVKEDEHFIELWRENFVLGIPEGHPLAIKDEIYIMDLLSVPLIARDYCTTGLLDAAHMAGVSFDIVASAFSEEWAIALVNEGLGVAILPENSIRAEHRIIKRQFSNMNPQRQVGIAYKKSKPLLPPVEKLFRRVGNNILG